MSIPNATPVDEVDPDSALPSVAARVTAFVSILLGGVGGAIIGYSFSHLQCHHGGCVGRDGITMVLGSLAGALGVAVIAVLTLRAIGEWRSPHTNRSAQTSGE